MNRREVSRMKKLFAIAVISVALLGPAQIALAASNEESVLMKLDEAQKQIETLRATIKTRMAAGKKMTDADMKEGMKMVDAAMKSISAYERRLSRDQR
jgi:hypothetical protein